MIAVNVIESQKFPAFSGVDSSCKHHFQYFMGNFQLANTPSNTHDYCYHVYW